MCYLDDLHSAELDLCSYKEKVLILQQETLDLLATAASF